MNIKKIIQDTTVSPDTPIRTAVDIIQNHPVKIALVCDESGRLLGTVTDGDVRRAIIDNVDLSGTVATIMNRHPKTTSEHTSRRAALDYMRRIVIRHLPQITDEGRVVNIFLLDELEDVTRRDNAVVLMAGGKGVRLRPLTDNTPKPLINIGGKPVLERLIEQFIHHGFHRFYISVNYLGEKIIEYCGNGSKWDVEIQYLRETEPLGTAGSLSLLEPQDHPFVVMNSDIITRTNFGHLLARFEEGGVEGTIGVREYLHTVPYGCVSEQDGKIESLHEKPTFRHMINAGIYVLSPSALKLISNGQRCDMPELFDMLLDRKKPTNIYIITEEWIDIGRREDLLWAQQVFGWEEHH
jgi:dTDP-glucose pyrophosphorylase